MLGLPPRRTKAEASGQGLGNHISTISPGDSSAAISGPGSWSHCSYHGRQTHCSDIEGFKLNIEGEPT